MARLAVRTTGRKITVFLTNAGSVEAGKRLATHPMAIKAQNCMKNNKTKGERIKCLKHLKA